MVLVLEMVLAFGDAWKAAIGGVAIRPHPETIHGLSLLSMAVLAE